MTNEEIAEDRDRLLKLGRALHLLAADQAAWSQATFGPDATRGPLGALEHLAKEAWEAHAAWVEYRHHYADADAADGTGLGPFATSPNLHRVEIADCFLLILDAARRAGMTPLDLIRAAEAKMAVNKYRKWPAPTPDRPVEHVRD